MAYSFSSEMIILGHTEKIFKTRAKLALGKHVGENQIMNGMMIAVLLIQGLGPVGIKPPECNFHGRNFCIALSEPDQEISVTFGENTHAYYYRIAIQDWHFLTILEGNALSDQDKERFNLTRVGEDRYYGTRSTPKRIEYLYVDRKPPGRWIKFYQPTELMPPADDRVTSIRKSLRFCMKEGSSMVCE